MDPNLPGGDRTVDRWFDTSAFALPAPFTFGTAPRNSVIGPGYANVDFSLAKDWAIAGLHRLEFRWEVFNATNHPSYGLPDTNLGSADFGTIRTTVGTPRQMQFGVKLVL